MATTRFSSRQASGICLCLLLFPVSAGAEDSVGNKIVSYLNSHLDQRVAGGSAWHMATEALRVSGGEFVPEELGADSPMAGDRVWGTLVTHISNSNGWSDSSPSSAALPGDVIQFRSAQFGELSLPVVFTAVVAEVNEGGRPRSVFCQNYNHSRKVKKVDLDAATLTSGWMRIYRPTARIDRLDEWKLTIVNHRSSAQQYDVLAGVDLNSTNTIDDDNTYGSFRVHWLKTDGTVPNLYHHSGGSFFLETGKGYEIPVTAGGSDFRQLED